MLYFHRKTLLGRRIAAVNMQMLWSKIQHSLLDSRNKVELNVDISPSSPSLYLSVFDAREWKPSRAAVSRIQNPALITGRPVSLLLDALKFIKRSFTLCDVYKLFVAMDVDVMES